MTDAEKEASNKAALAALTDDQRQMLEDLTSIQVELGKTDSQFAEHLTYSGTVWARCKSGDYYSRVEDSAKVLDQLAADLRALESQMASIKQASARKFYPFPVFRAALKGVNECRQKDLTDPDRLVVFLADTGGGKTELCRQLRAELKAVVITSRKTWKRYWACLQDLAENLAIDTVGSTNAIKVENEIIKRLRSRRRILCIDEGEYFGPDSIDLIKLLLNQTPVVIVLCCVPDAYKEWNRRNWIQARQLRRRTHILIQQRPIAPAEAGEFLKDIALNGCLKEASALLAAAANEFGRFDFLTRVAKDLHGRSNVELADVQKSAAFVHALIGFSASV